MSDETMAVAVLVRAMRPGEGEAVRAILAQIGWDAQYVEAAVANASVFLAAPQTRAACVAEVDGRVVGFLYVEFYAWNQLAQIQGLAVEPPAQRRGVAAALVRRAEDFARGCGARGIYVDTPTANRGGVAFYNAVGYATAYVMPRYYEDALDGVTFQKFFDA